MSQKLLVAVVVGAAIIAECFRALRTRLMICLQRLPETEVFQRRFWEHQGPRHVMALFRCWSVKRLLAEGANHVSVI